jgi:hypothetical protein
MDGFNMRSRQFVVIRHTTRNSAETLITSIFSSAPHSESPENHCVPVLETIAIPENPEECLLVTPLLRDCFSPPCENVGQCLELMRQLLEVRRVFVQALSSDDHLLQGLAFMHERGVCHG